MSVVEANSQQIAGSLRSRYYKYLEALCTSNGIDIITLKNGAVEVDILEMFFGGLPALIGLRYFDKLRVLCLISQDITNVNPLSEIANSLEELWICEGPLKDLSGLETCKQLRRLYLYDCSIESASQIAQLTSLDVLWIQNNRLRNMEFLDSLQFLTMLKAGGEQFSDPVSLSIEKWPPKLQHLDIDGNSLSSLQPILGACGCEIIRYFDVCSETYAPSRLIRDDRQMAWIAYHFPFLERLNRDVVTEKFSTNIGETAWFEEFNHSTKAERNLWISTDLIEKNAERISEKLTSLINALGKASNVVTKREGRRELAIKLQEQNQLQIKSLTKVKASMLEFKQALFYFSSYLLPSWRLESAYYLQTRDLNKNELQTLEDVLQKHCMRSDEPKLKLKFAITFIPSFSSSSDLGSSEMEKWSYVDSGTSTQLWDLRSVVELCDRRLSADYCTELKLFKNLLPICNNPQNSEVFVLTPLVKEKAINEEKTQSETKNLYDTTQNQEKTVEWSNLELVAVCLIELQRTAQFQFDELESWAVFEEHLNEQIKKLKEVGIDLKLEKVIMHREESIDENEENQEAVDAANKGLKKKSCVIDYFDADFPKCRYRTQQPWHGRRLSLRNPLELTIAYSRACSTFEKTQFYNTLTCLDLSDLKLSKLDGIENLSNLHCLNLSNNKFSNVKKLRILKSLTFLNIDGNRLSKIDDLPPLIIELRASRNHLTCLGFCAKLQLLTHLNVARNKIKTLKGIEHSKLLQIFIASDNLIKLANNELDIFANFPKLTTVDLVGNPILEMDGHRKRLLCIVPQLLSIDHEKVPVIERSNIVRKSGKVLTFEFIEKLVPDLETQSILNLNEHYFQMIALDRNATSKLQHITELNLSNNSLEHIYELVDLKSLKKLNLSHNQLIELSSSDFGNQNSEILPELEELNLSFNNLNCQSLSRIGLENLPGLRRLILVGNQLIRFDGPQFDFPNLQEIDCSQNEIRSIRKKTLSHLISLNLSDNKLKDIEGLEAPKIEYLNLANNRIGSCAALKAVKSMKDLKNFNCSGNPVTERRVYYEFIKGTLKNLEELDTKAIQNRSDSITSDHHDSIPINQGVSHEQTEKRPTISLPPLVKLANAQSSEAKRYHGLVKKKLGPSPNNVLMKSKGIESIRGVTQLVQLQSASHVKKIKAPRSHSIEINKLALLQSSKPNLNNQNLMISGTRIVKHTR